MSSWIQPFSNATCHPISRQLISLMPICPVPKAASKNHSSSSQASIVANSLRRLIRILSPPLILTNVLQSSHPRLCFLLRQIPFQLPLRLVRFRCSFLQHHTVSSFPLLHSSQRSHVEMHAVHTSAARAAALLASSLSPDAAFDPPNVWPWPVVLGMVARGVEEWGGAEPTVRPGWEKGSGLEGLPQRLPIAEA